MKTQNNVYRTVLVGALLTGIGLLAVWIRIQGVERLPEGQFTAHDPYLYYRQAHIISTEGQLPARDMDRWLPLGRDNTQLLPLFSYAIAYTHKVFPWWSVYQIQLYLPVLCFTLGLGGLFLFLTRCYDVMFASIVCVLLATLPGSIERSAAGFGDRDAWCWMLGVLAVTSYLYKEQIAPGRRRYLTTALAGFTVFLGGMSWEAFGVFVVIILATELYKFCTTDTEQRLKEYLLYLLMFVPWLYLISPAYHSGYGHTTHLFALTLAPPLSVFALRGTRYLLLKHIDSLRPHARKLAWGLTLLGIAAGASYMLLQQKTFATTAFTLFETKLMKSVGELADPNFKYWIDRYGTVFIFSSFGFILTPLKIWRWKSLPLVCSLVLFVATTFFREFLNAWTTPQTCDTLFFLSSGLTFLSLAGVVSGKRKTHPNEGRTLAMLAWFLFWVGLARGGKRFDFFIGVPIAFFSAEFLLFLANTFSETVEKNRQKILEISTAIIILSALMFVPIFGAYTQNTMNAATEMRKPVPGDNAILTAFHDMKKELPGTSIVAANWRYGGLLNVFSGVKTITDPDHYIPHWIALYNQHVLKATSKRQFLEFLKTHEATHLLRTRYDFVTTPFLREQQMDELRPVYPAGNFSKSPVKVWEIHYPPDIKPNVKYLQTGFPEIDKDLHLQ